MIDEAAGELAPLVGVRALPQTERAMVRSVLNSPDPGDKAPATDCAIWPRGVDLIPA